MDGENKHPVTWSISNHNPITLHFAEPNTTLVADTWSDYYPSAYAPGQAFFPAGSFLIAGDVDVHCSSIFQKASPMMHHAMRGESTRRCR
jgi:hypothetical protein